MPSTTAPCSSNSTAMGKQTSLYARERSDRADVGMQGTSSAQQHVHRTAYAWRDLHGACAWLIC
jgi:hypothetical protein